MVLSNSRYSPYGNAMMQASEFSESLFSASVFFLWICSMLSKGPNNDSVFTLQGTHPS